MISFEPVYVSEKGEEEEERVNLRSGEVCMSCEESPACLVALAAESGLIVIHIAVSSCMQCNLLLWEKSALHAATPL